MPDSIPSHAQVVIVGGGIVGCSVAYHLTKLGWREVVLLERRQLTCGTTWHAAGLVAQLRATENLTKLARYSQELYKTLEAETGQATGFRQCGAISIASNTERLEEIRRQASMASCFGVEAKELTPGQAQERWPLMHVDDVVGAFFFPQDARTNPTDTTQALARGARMGGAQIFENVAVTRLLSAYGRATGVETEQGTINADCVVNCAGMWARELGKTAGARVPLHAAEHYYLVSEPMDGMHPDLPVLRDMDNFAYYREETGKLLLGLFEPEAVPWGQNGIPEDFCFDELPPDWDRLHPYLDRAMRRIPALENTGIQLLFNGPESFTPDDRYWLGEAPEVRGLFVAAGFNSIGIQSAGGAGKVLADWIVQGHQPMDLWDVTTTRMMPFQNNAKYLFDRTSESLGLLYDMHWPFKQYTTARGIRKSILHDRLLAAGACFGELAGWERANWFAPNGERAEYHYSFGRQNWFAWHAEEHRAVREGVGLFDQSSFSKFMVQGRDAESVLNRICANNIAVAVGQSVYTQWLNAQGTIEADLTVTRVEDQGFLIVTAPATHTHVETWLSRNIPGEANVVVTDVTSGLMCINIQGPRSRALLSAVSDQDFSSAAFPFASLQELEIGYATVKALRLTYMGELGWELYVPTEFGPHVYDVLIAAGQAFELRHCGYHTLQSLRLEKAYREYGHDLGYDETPVEAGLSFACDFEKASGFIGKEALLLQKQQGVKKRLVQFLLEDPEPLLYHAEPIYRDSVLCGYTSSAMYGHTLGASVALGYVKNEAGVDADYVRTGSYEIEVAGKRYKAQPALRPLYDPKSERIRV
ncbi:MAG: GcvT family protein [Pseudomonadales bacterium]